jgi:hypothetical protein
MSKLEVDAIEPQSGTSLTLGASGDTISVPSGATLDASNATLTLPDDSVTAAKLDSTAVDNTNTNSTVITGQTAETSIDGADSILIYDDSATALRKMTRTNFVAGIGGTNTPAFEAYLSSAQTVSDETITKAQANTELFDTDSAYDNSSTYRFTPQVAGKYLLWGVIAGYSGDESRINVVKSLIYKNGAVARNVTLDMRANPARYIMPHVQTIQEANGSSDYFEFFGFVNGTTGTQTFDASPSNFDGTRWGAYRIIE